MERPPPAATFIVDSDREVASGAGRMTKRMAGPDPRSIRVLFGLGRIGTLTDGQLLERFTSGDGESGELAFAAIVERHGPMVLGVCKSVLGDEDAARDAFQATFLILLRKSRSLWTRDSLAPWLHRVARRAAANARSAGERRRFHERRAAESRATYANPVDRDDEVARILHEEIARLPIRYRVPLVICDLEGRTHEEASRHLRCPIGTVKSRLSRGRERLRDRMTRRGIGLSVGLIAARSAERARAAIPESLIDGTLEIVKRIATGREAVGAASSAVVLSRRVLRAMFLKQWAMTATFATAVAALAFGAGTTNRRDEGEPTRTDAVQTRSDPAPKRSDGEPGRTITVRVLDRGGQPLKGANIVVNHWYKLPGNDRSRDEKRDLRTDAEGRAAAALSGTSDELTIRASGKGFVPLRAMWSKKFQPDGDQIPKEFTFKLDPGTVIGGVVVDEEGRPIAGAKVDVRDLFANAMEPGGSVKRLGRPSSFTHQGSPIVTDERGSWKLDNVPSDRDLIGPVGPFVPRYGVSSGLPVLTLSASHPDYPREDRPRYIFIEGERKMFKPGRDITLKSLRDGTAKIVLMKK